MNTHLISNTSLEHNPKVDLSLHQSAAPAQECWECTIKNVAMQELDPKVWLQLRRGFVCAIPNWFARGGGVRGGFSTYKQTLYTILERWESSPKQRSMRSCSRKRESRRVLVYLTYMKCFWITGK